jgi:two-component system response regulator AtoC
LTAPESPTFRIDRPPTPPPTGRSLLVLAPSATSWHPLPDTGQITLGRGELCDIRITDASVSRTHARLDLTPDTIRIADLGSANGIIVRGRQHTANDPVDLSPGDVVEIGTVSVVVQSGPVRAGRDGWVATNTSATGPAVLVPAAPLPNRTRDDGIVTGDPAMKRVLDLVDRVAPSTMTVLLTGETGVGKEVIAAALHAASGRTGRFVKLNCAALAPSIVESELFGYERGAFTGAAQSREGLIEAADGGTLLLDEVGEMPLELQAKLLRVIEDREVTRDGGRDPRRIDVRFAAATNRDLRDAAARGTFRRDLYYRLNGIAITIPPLRDRPADILPLAKRFAGRQTLTSATISTLRAYDWPGNVRELKNAIERAALLAGPGHAIEPEHLPEDIITGAPPRATSDTTEPEDDERARILAALEECAGNQTRAAKLLGISRRTLVTRLSDYGIARPRK